VLTVSNANNMQINDYDANDPDIWCEKTIFVTDKATGVTTQHSGVTSLVVNGTSGADQISASLDTGIGASFYGHDGSDTILIGGNGSGTLLIDGGAGNDKITVTSAARANRPNNILVIGGPGKDTFNGSAID
jgi:Ca2+-binding RTX toxin-like protein